MMQESIRSSVKHVHPGVKSELFVKELLKSTENSCLPKMKGVDFQLKKELNCQIRPELN